jgi:hypothetical protein
MTKQRFVVSPNLPPDKRQEGYRFEVIDSTHPSDGGPVAVAWFRTRETAEADAQARTIEADLDGYRVQPGEAVFVVHGGPHRPGVFSFAIIWLADHVVSRNVDGEEQRFPYRAQEFKAEVGVHVRKWQERGFQARIVDERVDRREPIPEAQ